MYQKFLKRLFDLFFSILGLIILSPVFLLIAVCVRIFLGSPVLFKQQRPGFHEKLFWLIKFRTMKDLYSDKGELLPDENRLTEFGKFLRKMSLDELPEFWNILKGEMSFVGPRPLLMDYLPLYSAEQKQRHEVKPGITGWAQVNGRNAISWEEKFKLDVWYADHISFKLDMKILWMTFIKVFKREGISQEGQATMEKFDPK